MDFKFEITDLAVETTKQKLISRGTPDSSLRIGISGSGCNGFKYVFLFEDNSPRERDYLIIKNDVKFIIDKKSAIYLNGTILDYKKTILEEGFELKNPNVASHCGCGKSFDIKI